MDDSTGVDPDLGVDDEMLTQARRLNARSVKTRLGGSLSWRYLSSYYWEEPVDSVTMSEK